jgi:hypothetical protein
MNTIGGIGHGTPAKLGIAPSQLYNKKMVVNAKLNMRRELDKQNHQGQLLAHKRQRLLKELENLVKDRQLVQEEFPEEYIDLAFKGEDGNHRAY